MRPPEVVARHDAMIDAFYCYLFSRCHINSSIVSASSDSYPVDSKNFYLTYSSWEQVNHTIHFLHSAKTLFKSLWNLWKRTPQNISCSLYGDF
jgi:hypothetical protein